MSTFNPLFRIVLLLRFLRLHLSDFDWPNFFSTSWFTTLDKLSLGGWRPYNFFLDKSPRHSRIVHSLGASPFYKFFPGRVASRVSTGSQSRRFAPLHFFSTSRFATLDKFTVSALRASTKFFTRRATSRLSTDSESLETLIFRFLHIFAHWLLLYLISSKISALSKPFKKFRLKNNILQ